MRLVDIVANRLGITYKTARSLINTGFTRVNGEVQLDHNFTVHAGDRIVIDNLLDINVGD